ncbi:MAG: hypothetical protein ACJAYU_004892 [Bradymonadia bacterium]|jgi:hypothetical protein
MTRKHERDIREWPLQQLRPHPRDSPEWRMNPHNSRAFAYKMG